MDIIKDQSPRQVKEGDSSLHNLLSCTHWYRFERVMNSAVLVLNRSETALYTYICFYWRNRSLSVARDCPWERLSGWGSQTTCTSYHGGVGLVETFMLPSNLDLVGSCLIINNSCQWIKIFMVNNFNESQINTALTAWRSSIRSCHQPYSDFEIIAKVYWHEE